MAAVSFHETKNVIAGEGGALLLNDDRFITRAEIIRDKGTDRRQFQRGQVDKYTWVDLGSSYVPSEITAAFLFAQMEAADRIMRERLKVWGWSYERAGELEITGRVRRPIVPPGCDHNAHIFYLLLSNPAIRPQVLGYLNDHGVNAVFHYVPLHSSGAGRRFGRTSGPLRTTDAAAERLIRLPLWMGMDEDDVDRVVAVIQTALE